jgi:integrase
MASVQPTAAGGWRVSVCKMGVRDTKTFPKGTSKTEAKGWGTTREAEILAADKKARSKTGHTWRQLIEAWMEAELPKRESYEWEAGRCRWFMENLPFIDKAIRKTETDDIDEWVVDRQREVSGSSINRDLQLLGPIVKWGIKKKWLSHNPLEGVDKPENAEPRDMRISQSDEDAIVQALGHERGVQPASKAEKVAVLFLLALETGMRRGEMLKTKWVDVHEDYIHLPSRITKNRSKRDVPLSQAARALVRSLQQDGELLFGGLSADTADALFRDARKRAGRHDLHFHDTRHEAVTRLARKLEVLALARMIGHRDLNSLQIYYNPTAREIAPLLG